MADIGRPTLYKPEYDEQARDRCLLGGTNADLADLFEVGRRTIDHWIADIPSFAGAVRAGRVVADMAVVRRLYQRALGYDRTVERTVLHCGEERTLASTVHYPPDTQACIFWLRNRQREIWGSRRMADKDDVATEEMLAALDAAGERAAAARGQR